jgi:Domain of unknown function (DUF222)/HNH endonuclease
MARWLDQCETDGPPESAPDRNGNTLVAAHMAAGECRWLQLVAEFDRREAWASWGCASTAHWLNYRCSIDLGAARERVRVARRLGELPLVTAAFSVGELSYSKVRAITRVATEANEELLVDLARSATASHVERMVRHYRQVNKTIDQGESDAGDAPDLYEDRFLSTQWNDDGSLSIRAKLPPAEGETVLAALRRACDALFRRRSPTADVSAETSDDDLGAESPPPADAWGARQADALVAMAETVVADGLRPGSGPNRHTVVIHTTVDDLQGDADEGAGAYLEDGPVLGGETVRRLMCDSSIMFVLEGPDGTVINVSPRAPSIPAALSRAVKLRDDGCVFPGCTWKAFVDVHHIRHRADKGENSLANCSALCRVHHRMVHEGGFSMKTLAPGQFEFYRPDGTTLRQEPITVAAGDDWVRDFNARHGIVPSSDSPVPDWDGIRPDYPYIIDLLLEADGRLQDDPHWAE